MQQEKQNMEPLKKEAMPSQEETVLVSQESKEQVQTPKTQTLQHFWDEIISGEFKSITDEDISEIINTVYLSQPTLTSLKEEELSKIKESLKNSLDHSIGRKLLQELAEKEIIFLPELSTEEILKMVNSRDEGRPGPRGYIPESPAIEITLDSGEKVKIRVEVSPDKKRCEVQFENLSFVLTRPNFFTLSIDPELIDRGVDSKGWEDKIIPVIRKLGGVVMDKRKKVDTFSDINIWGKASYHALKHGQPLTMQGYRNLYAQSPDEIETYGYTKERFTDLVANIRKRTGKENINMLDIGGGLGTASFQVEQLDNHIHATNLTIDEEPAMYPVERVLAPAEAMPESFREKYDLMVSNQAFRYFTYPDIALENCLKALSIGGEAEIVVGTSRQNVEVKDYAVRLAKEYKRLKELNDKGFIEFKILKTLWGDPLESQPKEGDDTFPEAFIKIIKLKSLEE